MTKGALAAMASPAIGHGSNCKAAATHPFGRCNGSTHPIPDGDCFLRGCMLTEVKISSNIFWMTKCCFCFHGCNSSIFSLTVSELPLPFSILTIPFLPAVTCAIFIFPSMHANKGFQFFIIRLTESNNHMKITECCFWLTCETIVLMTECCYVGMKHECCYWIDAMWDAGRFSNSASYIWSVCKVLRKAYADDDLWGESTLV